MLKRTLDPNSTDTYEGNSPTKRQLGSCSEGQADFAMLNETNIKLTSTFLPAEELFIVPMDLIVSTTPTPGSADVDGEVFFKFMEADATNIKMTSFFIPAKELFTIPNLFIDPTMPLSVIVSLSLIMSTEKSTENCHFHASDDPDLQRESFDRPSAFALPTTCQTTPVKPGKGQFKNHRGTFSEPRKGKSLEKDTTHEFNAPMSLFEPATSIDRPVKAAKNLADFFPKTSPTTTVKSAKLKGNEAGPAEMDMNFTSKHNSSDGYPASKLSRFGSSAASISENRPHFGYGWPNSILLQSIHKDLHHRQQATEENSAKPMSSGAPILRLADTTKNISISPFSESSRIKGHNSSPIKADACHTSESSVPNGYPVFKPDGYNRLSAWNALGSSKRRDVGYGGSTSNVTSSGLNIPFNTEPHNLEAVYDYLAEPMPLVVDSTPISRLASVTESFLTSSLMGNSEDDLSSDTIGVSSSSNNSSIHEYPVFKPEDFNGLSARKSPVLKNRPVVGYGLPCSDVTSNVYKGHYRQEDLNENSDEGNLGFKENQESPITSNASSSSIFRLAGTTKNLSVSPLKENSGYYSLPITVDGGATSMSSSPEEYPVFKPEAFNRLGGHSAPVFENRPVVGFGWPNCDVTNNGLNSFYTGPNYCQTTASNIFARPMPLIVTTAPIPCPSGFTVFPVPFEPYNASPMTMNVAPSSENRFPFGYQTINPMGYNCYAHGGAPFSENRRHNGPNSNFNRRQNRPTNQSTQYRQGAKHFFGYSSDNSSSHGCPASKPNGFEKIHLAPCTPSFFKGSRLGPFQ